MISSRKIGRLATAIGTVSMVIPAAACDGSFQSLPIQQKDPQSTQIFIGLGRTVSVEFINESGNSDVRAFPEPPMTIRSNAIQQSCQVVEGGVWLRASAHLSKDEKVLMLLEYSGSYNALVFYDTSSCKELRRLEISDARWELRDDHLMVGKSCSGETLSGCKDIDRFEFDKTYLPRPLGTISK